MIFDRGVVLFNLTAQIMNNTFEIVYMNNPVKVESKGKTTDGHKSYIVHLPDDELHLIHTEDDEGAGRWMDTQTDNETEVSGEIGQLIELYLVQQPEER